MPFPTPLRHVARRAALAAALAALPLAATAQSPAAAAVDGAAAPDGERRHLFHVEWGPIELAEVAFSVSERDGRVELNGVGRSKGLAAVVADFEIKQRAVYEADGARRRYRTTARWGDRTIRRALRWDGTPEEASAPSVEVATVEPEALTPIPAEEMLGTVDPVWPVWDVIGRIAAGEGCAGTWRMFDGVRRLDLTLSDEGREVLEADRDWTWGGEAQRCRLSFRRVAGFPVDSEPRAAESEYDRILWFGTVDGRPTPVRLSVDWPLGSAVARIDLR